MDETGTPIAALVAALADAEPHTFTPLHHQIALQALRTKSYSAALPVLDNDIYRLSNDAAGRTDGSSPPQTAFGLAPPNPNAFGYQEIVSYFLYGGMIYLAVGNYDRAILFLELATTYPANNIASMIQVEAYKKWILINLLHRGRVPALPRNLVGHHAKILGSLAKAYQTVAEAFRKPDHEHLTKTIAAGQAIWAQDLNVGLISLVLRAHQRFAISSLSKVYQSISIGKIRQLAFPKTSTHNEVYEYIANLIATGQLFATLTSPGSDSSAAYLRFVSPAIEGPDVERERVQLALKQQAKIEVLNEYVKDMTHTLQLTKPYLDALHKSKKKSANAEGSSNGTANLGGGPGNVMVEDEDEYLESL